MTITAIRPAYLRSSAFKLVLRSDPDSDGVWMYVRHDKLRDWWLGKVVRLNPDGEEMVVVATGRDDRGEGAPMTGLLRNVPPEDLPILLSQIEN